MAKFDSFRFERLLRQIHKWLGVFLLPWIVAIGVTGLYLNHERLFAPVLPEPRYDETQFDAWPDPKPVDLEGAFKIALDYWPDDFFLELDDHSFRGRDVFDLEGDVGRVIVDQKTGHFWVRTRYLTRLYTPDGKRAAFEVRWGRVLNSIHRRGWVGSTLGTWLADITAGAMIVFGLTGLYIFLAPRARKRRAQKARRRAAEAS